MPLRHCNSRARGAAVTGWALPPPLARAPVGPAAAVLGSAQSPPGCAPRGHRLTPCRGTGGPNPGARPSPAWHSGAIRAPAPSSLQTPSAAHRCGVPIPASAPLPQHRWPNTLRTDTHRCCRCLPVPPGPGAEEVAPGPVSCAPRSPLRACAPLSPALASLSLSPPGPTAGALQEAGSVGGFAGSQGRRERPQVCSQPGRAQLCLAKARRLAQGGQANPACHPACHPAWAGAGPPHLRGSDARKRGRAVGTGSPPAPSLHRRLPPPLPRPSQLPAAQEGQGARGCGGEPAAGTLLPVPSKLHVPGCTVRWQGAREQIPSCQPGLA